MNTKNLNKSEINQIIEISKSAGHSIQEIYEGDFDFSLKNDGSPITEADFVSNRIICNFLEDFSPNIPILSEENSDIPFLERASWESYWLVDPLDGTKEFIKGNGEFTVNIALIKNNQPIFGVVHAPALKQTFWGSRNYGSFAISKTGAHNKNFIKTDSDGPIKVVSSRSHKSEKDLMFLNSIGDFSDQQVGSSLKLCFLASGKADIYPRFGKTSEWDIAAGHAVLTFAGGTILGNDGKKIQYNMKESLLNNSFIAFGNLNKRHEYICSKFYALIV